MTDGCLAGGLRRIRFVRESDGPPIPKELEVYPTGTSTLSHEDLAAKAPGDFGRGRSFEEQRKRIDEVSSGFFVGRALARDVELRAQRLKNVVLALNNRG